MIEKDSLTFLKYVLQVEWSFFCVRCVELFVNVCKTNRSVSELRRWRQNIDVLCLEQAATWCPSTCYRKTSRGPWCKHKLKHKIQAFITSWFVLKKNEVDVSCFIGQHLNWLLWLWIIIINSVIWYKCRTRHNY